MKKNIAAVFILLTAIGVCFAASLPSYTDEDSWGAAGERSLLAKIFSKQTASSGVLPVNVYYADEQARINSLSANEMAVCEKAHALNLYLLNEAYNRWRRAANAFLPDPKYQLPALLFKEASGVSAFKLRSQPYGGFTQNPNAMGVLQRSQNGNFFTLVLRLPEGYDDYAKVANRPVEEQQAAIEKYQLSTCAFVAACEWCEYDYKEYQLHPEKYRNIKAMGKMKQCMDEYNTTSYPAEEWATKTLLYDYLQHIMNHELGHAFGFIHANNQQSTMYKVTSMPDYYQRFISKQDGEKLAELVCLYHNTKAHKTVCKTARTKEIGEDARAQLADIVELNEQIADKSGKQLQKGAAARSLKEPTVKL